MRKCRVVLVVASFMVIITSCQESGKPPGAAGTAGVFDAGRLTIKDADSVRKVKGQVLYVPVYSNLPCKMETTVDLSALIAIHNTDLQRPIRVAKVLYFDNDGKLVSDFVSSDIVLGPLAATHFRVPRRDRSGTGANFLVEWLADGPVTEPVVESVMIDCDTCSGLSFPSRGRVIREIR